LPIVSRSAKAPAVMTASMSSRRASSSSARIGNFHDTRWYTRARLAGLLRQLATCHDAPAGDADGFFKPNSLARDTLKTSQVH
jgi:hypothetical protein